MLFFGAFNWEHLGHMQKFGLLEMLIAAFFAGTLLRGLSSIEGRVLLGCASVLVGGLLAVIGQEYQTGADAYLLFLSWAGLIFPWDNLGFYIFHLPLRQPWRTNLSAHFRRC